MSIAIQKITFVTAQSHSSKKLKEKDYAIKLGRQSNSPELERLRFEAYSIRSQITAEMEQIEQLQG